MPAATVLLAAAAGSSGISPTVVPNLVPKSSGLPGTQVLVGLANGLGFWALIAAVVGVVVGAVVWARVDKTATRNRQVSAVCGWSAGHIDPPGRRS